MSTAGVLVIGNEVLSGKVEEENARFLVQRLRALGVDLVRIAVVKDDVDTIAREVRAMADAYTWVFTSGGVGSTHDDVTLAGIAQAFEVPLAPQAEILALLEAHFGARMNPAVRRMAMLPEGTELLGVGELRYPLVRVRNVHVFPGVPEFLRAKFSWLEPQLAVTPFVLYEVYLNVAEDQIAIPLAEEDARFADIDFGSYPKFDDPTYKTKLTVEGRDGARVAEARAALLGRLAPEWVVREVGPC